MVRCMTDEASDAGKAAEEELRTIAFRLREIQRLVGMRVAQENRRLEQQGLEPVDESEFFRNPGTEINR